MHETHAKTTTSRLLLCYSIYMDFHGSSSSGKKKVLKVPITQAAKLFEGERENDLMKKMLLLLVTTFRFLQKVSRIIWGPFLKVSKGRSNDWSFLRSSFMIMNAELLTLKLEVLMAIFSRFIKL